ncbi:hypothetical protein L9F63_026634 [Diploptera punctata]|uniref:Phospholipase A2 n=2 Tax=Diploptera punctata TaxID=6984 RepID=A0AAD8AHP1_DIPPU|nr:hypothetical protein L9F63_026634 [Diploptera punctata]
MKKLLIFSLLLSLVWPNNSDGIVSDALRFGLMLPDWLIGSNNHSGKHHNIIEGTYEEVVKKLLMAGANAVDSVFKPIAPGTKWCGRGNRANSPDDLGIFEFTDDCCRHHDNCSDHIHVGETKHGLKNTGIYTRSHCDCDDAFYDCLKDDNSLVSLELGRFYFNVLRTQCFKMEYPFTESCRKKNWSIFSFSTCVKKMDTSRPKEWQWFDAKTY